MPNNNAPKNRAAKKAASPQRVAKNAAAKRLAMIEQKDPKFLLPKFVEVVNGVVEKFLPEIGAADGRVKNEFSPRTVRAYQNKGIIDKPFRDGKNARYGYRHFLQALLVRRLLAEGLRAPRINSLLAEKSNKEYLELLTGNAQLALRPAERGARKMAAMKQAEAIGQGGGADRGPWARLKIAPGLELNVASGFTPPSSTKEREKLLRSIKVAFRQEMTLRRQQRASARD